MPPMAGAIPMMPSMNCPSSLRKREARFMAVSSWPVVWECRDFNAAVEPLLRRWSLPAVPLDARQYPLFGDQLRVAGDQITDEVPGIDANHQRSASAAKVLNEFNTLDAIGQERLSTPLEGLFVHNEAGDPARHEWSEAAFNDFADRKVEIL